MLAIQKPKGSSRKCCPNVLPCRVHHNGPVNASARYWRPRIDKDGTNITYFRGRRLQGNVVKVPDGYEGLVLEKTHRVVQPNESTRDVYQDRPENENDEGEEREADDEDAGTCLAMDQVASFDEFVTWGHEAAPDKVEDPYTKGIDEWIKFAHAMHSYERDDEKSRSS